MQTIKSRIKLTYERYDMRFSYQNGPLVMPYRFCQLLPHAITTRGTMTCVLVLVEVEMFYQSSSK